MPTRRDVLARALAGIALPALSLGLAGVAAPARGHTPYGQWVVYRQKHLLVGAHRGDPVTYDLAKAVVAGLEEELPSAQARVARGPRPQRIAALMGTGQLSLAVLSADEAAAMAGSLPPFEDYRPTPVQTIGDLGDGYFLFAAPEFLTEHAHLVTEALDHAGVARPPSAEHHLHPGALAYWSA